MKLVYRRSGLIDTTACGGGLLIDCWFVCFKRSFKVLEILRLEERKWEEVL